ncbi:hypothetical protein Bbelb_019630 [Branchiostoma belcheri]|nr:hypothetical protein Bbelb_019630 [Branchiostoma belcheri]
MPLKYEYYGEHMIYTPDTYRHLGAEAETGEWLIPDPSWAVDATIGKWRSTVIHGVSYYATKALDGNTGTYWNPWGVLKRNYNRWNIVLDLKAPTTLTRIALNNFGDTYHDVAAFKLQTSQFGSPYNWEDVVYNNDVKGGTKRKQEFGRFKGTARFWRFVVTRTHKGGFQPWLRELNLYGISLAKLSDGEAPPFPQHAMNPKGKQKRDTHKAQTLAPACRIHRQPRELRFLTGGMEPYSLQVGRSAFQWYTHVQCADTDPVVSCSGQCLTKASEIRFLVIYRENGKVKVRPELVQVSSGCEFEMEL